MKFLLLKTLLLRRAKDEGFTLPMVMAIGLIMILLSAVNLAKSSEENLNTLSQQGLSNAIAMAEVGITRYRELLDRNRVLAVYNLSEWTTNNFVTSQVCDAISNTGGGWADSTSNTWRDIQEDIDGDGTAETIGQYKVVNYIYENDNNPDPDNGIIDITDDINNDSRAILTIKGRDGNNSTASEAQLQVEIPIGSNAGEDTDGDGVYDEGDMDGLSPALWIRNNSRNFASIGNLTVNNGNIVLSVHSNGITDACNSPNTDLNGNDLTPYSTAGTLRIDPRILPRSLDFTGITFKDIDGDIDGNTNPADNLLFGDKINSSLLLGTKELDNSDPPNETAPLNADGRYYYRVIGNLNITDGQKLLAEGNQKTIVYVTGDVNISGSADIATPEDVNPATDNINFSTYIGNSDSNALEIHTEGNVNISGSGTVNIKALIYAPNDAPKGKVTIENSVNVNMIGSIWAQDLNNTTSGTVNITPNNYKFYSVADQRTPRPITYRITDWERQEVN